jgi:haloacid dehalogenase superfamily, subfamily IA, variant 3 with third motif having DD or ED
MIGPEDIDALLFDFGGVLVEIDFSLVTARWAELAGRPMAEVQSRFVHGDAYARHERGEMDIAAYCDSLRRDLRIEIDDNALIDGWQRVFVSEIEPTARLVRELKGRIPIYVFSNTNATHHAFWRARHASTLEPFDRVFVSSELGARKPEREAFERVAGEIGAPLGRILFFDDTPANITAARKLGMPAVLVRSPEDVLAAVRPWLDVMATRKES